MMTHITMCMQWYDYRLNSLDSVPVDTTYISVDNFKINNYTRFWMPVVQIRNALSASQPSNLVQYDYMVVKPKLKLLRRCQRLMVNLICFYEFHMHNFEEHYCDFELQSCELLKVFKSTLLPFSLFLKVQNVNSYTTNIAITRMYAPFDYHGTGTNMLFRVRNTYITKCFKGVLNVIQMQLGGPTNDLSCARAGFQIVRRVDYYIMRYYCPTFLMVAIAYMSLFFPINSFPARIVCTTFTLVTSSSLSINAYNESPAGYMTDLTWWFFTVELLIWMYMFEYTVAMAWYYYMIDKKIARDAGVVSCLNWYVSEQFSIVLSYRKVPMDTILARKLGTVVTEKLCTISSILFMDTTRLPCRPTLWHATRWTMWPELLA